jgi:hypothetical protein
MLAGRVNSLSLLAAICYAEPAVRRFNAFWVICGLASLLTGLARGETFQLNDGQTLAGDPISFDENGLIVRQPDGKYSERTPWPKFSQEDLKKIATNPKAARFVQPFIEIPPEEKAKRDEIPLKPVPRLKRPAGGSLLGALFSSPVGLAVLFILYLANIYAGHEIAISREQPKALVCGLAAVVPIISPIIFLCLPAWLKSGREATPLPQVEPLAERAAAPSVETAPGQPTTKFTLATPDNSEAPAIPGTKVFARGEFMFNRRFFETKFPGFFAIVRRENDRDMLLIVKSARGQYVVQRITRISANDLHAQVTAGVVSQEIVIPFVEISQVTLKHKNAS